MKYLILFCLCFNIYASELESWLGKIQQATYDSVTMKLSYIEICDKLYDVEIASGKSNLSGEEKDVIRKIIAFNKETIRVYIDSKKNIAPTPVVPKIETPKEVDKPIEEEKVNLNKIKITNVEFIKSANKHSEVSGGIVVKQGGNYGLRFSVNNNNKYPVKNVLINVDLLYSSGGKKTYQMKLPENSRFNAFPSISGNGGNYDHLIVSGGTTTQGFTFPEGFANYRFTVVGAEIDKTNQ